MRLRRAALFTVVGYVLTWGVAFADFGVLPKIYVADSAALTLTNALAHQRLLACAIFAFLLNFLGDAIAAWGLWLMLRPVNEAVSALAAWLRLIFSAVGISATMNLVTAFRLVSRPAALDRPQLEANVYVALGAFNSQFAFALVFFGFCLLVLAWLMWRASYFPKWLASAIGVAGAGWLAMQSAPYFGLDLGFLFFTSFGELFLLVWLIGWGTRLPDLQRS